MKFSTISRLIYLRRARHRGGHGIHSPFLFRLITNVIEDKFQYPEYQSYKENRTKAIRLLTNFPDPTINIIFNRFNLSLSKPKKLYKKLEFPSKFGKLIFRLIREFHPAYIFHYGPTLGVNLILMAMANGEIPVYQVCDDPEYSLFADDLIKESECSNILTLTENQDPAVLPPFMVVNYPKNPELSRKMIQKYITHPGENDVLIIRGIHWSLEMETLWKELIINTNVRVTVDQFEIGIVLFRKGLQKEDFILRF